MKSILYTLADPRSPAEIRYVGWTSQTPARRLTNHIVSIRTKGNNRRLAWLRSILYESLRPIIRTVAILDSNDEAKRCEVAYIARLRSTGSRLVNTTDGGEGTPGLIPTAETRAKMSAFMRNLPRGPEWCARIGEANRRRNPEIYAKVGAKTAAFHTGRHLTVEHRAKISAGGCGKKHPPRSAEWCAHISESKQGKWHSPESCGYKCAAHRSQLIGNR